MLHACAVHAPEPSCVVTTTALAPAFQGNMLWMQPKLPAKQARIRAFHETCAECFWHFGIEGKVRNHPAESQANVPLQQPGPSARPAWVGKACPCHALESFCFFSRSFAPVASATKTVVHPPRWARGDIRRASQCHDQTF